MGLAVHTGLEGVGAQRTAAGVADAEKRAALLGQSGSVATEIGSLGGNAAAARGTVAGAGYDAMANIGLSKYSDMGRRAATGARDRIRARMDNEAYRREAQGEVKASKKEKGQYMVTQLSDLLQQQEENLLARLGLKIDQKQWAAEQKLAQKQFQWSKQDDKIDNAQAAENAKDDGDGGGGGGEDKPGDLSPSQKEEYRQKVQKIKGVMDIYRNLIRKGIPPERARKKARQKSGAEQYMVTIAAQLVNNGKLNAKGKHLAKGAFPAGVIPNKWT
jgi:hypothetical protein